MTDKEKLHQILSSLWKNDNSVGKTYYNQALQDVQTAIDLQEEPVSEELGEIVLEGTNFNKSWYAHPELAFKAGAKWQKEQKYVWSEEDEETMSGLLSFLLINTSDKWVKYGKWLKSLKQRMGGALKGGKP